MRTFSVLLMSLPSKYKSLWISPVRLEITVRGLVENASVINSNTQPSKNWCMPRFSTMNTVSYLQIELPAVAI